MKTAKEIFEEELSGEPLTQDSVIEILNEVMFDMFREGYFAGNVYNQSYKGTLITENIIKKDFNKLFENEKN